MIEKQMAEKLQRIFDLDKSVFDLPGESQEQECLFIEVEESRSIIRESKHTARVTGVIHVFTQADKMPYGYFAKKIAEADPSDSKDFFFFDVEQNGGTYLNINERTTRFVYLFNSQYNPAMGTINQVTLETEYTE